MLSDVKQEFMDFFVNKCGRTTHEAETVLGFIGAACRVNEEEMPRVNFVGLLEETRACAEERVFAVTFTASGRFMVVPPPAVRISGTRVLLQRGDLRLRTEDGECRLDLRFQILPEDSLVLKCGS